MCRLLLIRSETFSDFTTILSDFGEACRNSSEYQGHGWGISMLTSAGWKNVKSIDPIWEFDMSTLPAFTHAIIHARSAFRDEGITIENNMPFQSDRYIFAFNGELTSVKIRAKGRIGAEKIFNFILKFEKYGMEEAIKKGNVIISQRSGYIRAMNHIIHDRSSGISYVNSFYSKDEHDYYALNKSHCNGLIMVSSVIFGDHRWDELKNHTLEIIS